MATRLIVMRHATAGRTLIGESDHQRKLTEYGRKETILMSNELSRLEWVPDMAFVSSSARTRETHSLLTSTPIEVREEMYLAEVETLFSIVEDIDVDKTTLLLGHNPSCELLIANLCNHFHEMPPASCALFREEGTSWILEKILRTAELF